MIKQDCLCFNEIYDFQGTVSGEALYMFKVTIGNVKVNTHVWLFMSIGVDAVQSLFENYCIL